MTMTAAPVGVLTYNLDPMHSSARFSVRHMMISHVRGDFAKLSGTLTLDPANPSNSHVEVEIDVASINTGQPQRDEHLRTGDFFEAAKFPTITFISTNIEITEVNDLYGSLRVGFEATTKIKRSEFGLMYNAALETGGVVIGDDVNIIIDVQFNRAK
jgi:polyisoprenoid-binding protein YceI